MKQPDLHGDLAVKTLYDFEYLSEVDNKVANPIKNSNLYGRPSLIPGVEYPISEREQYLLNLGYDKGYDDAARLNKSNGQDPFLNVLRKRVEQIRKEKIKKGLIEPATKQERKWRLGL